MAWTGNGRILMRVRSLAATLAVALSLVAAAARADQPGFDLQLFHPAVDSKGYITVNASQVLGLWDFSFGLVGTLAAKPLYLDAPAVGSGQPVHMHNDFLLTPTLQAALGFKYAELAVTLPVQINFGGYDPKYHSPHGSNFDNSLSYSGQGVGDIGIHLKGRFLNTSKHPVGLALLASVYVPTQGKASDFLSDGTVGVIPTAIVDKEFGRTRRFRMALNVGAHLRFGGSHTFKDTGQLFTDQGNNPPMTQLNVCAPTSNGMGAAAIDTGMKDSAGKEIFTCAGAGAGTGQSRSLGHQLTYGLGASYAVVKDRFDVVGEVYGAAGLDGAANSFPLEGLLGAKVYLARNSFFSIGGGGSLIPNQTQGAQWRLFVGFVFEPAIGDRDGDGIKDDVDKCPDDPEDFDDFEDTDGCPDPDNDRDGILDVDDKCPNEPETKNGFQDEDGCPDSVELDRDGDGIPDDVDKCPDDPEDKDGFEDEDGCPDPDNDKDGILDVDDLCPNEPEDKDGFEDQDGCPDPDNDKDRILDVNDKCPNEPETYNGFEDEDGCPDKGRVVVRRGKLEILDKIYFETDKAIIKPISYPILDAITATLKGNPQILLMEIQGHADERGDDDHNMKLTEDRSQAVKQYLIDHGVETDRLQAHGYGETKPVCKSHNEECWSKNRRVEFVILKRSDSGE
jgi:outer membrane protein OmpA-like peptidoglycan-associated protein